MLKTSLILGLASASVWGSAVSAQTDGYEIEITVLAWGQHDTRSTDANLSLTGPVDDLAALQALAAELVEGTDVSARAEIDPYGDFINPFAAPIASEEREIARIYVGGDVRGVLAARDAFAARGFEPAELSLGIRRESPGYLAAFGEATRSAEASGRQLAVPLAEARGCEVTDVSAITMLHPSAGLPRDEFGEFWTTIEQVEPDLDVSSSPDGIPLARVRVQLNITFSAHCP